MPSLHVASQQPMVCLTWACMVRVGEHGVGGCMGVFGGEGLWGGQGAVRLELEVSFGCVAVWMVVVCGDCEALWPCG